MKILFVEDIEEERDVYLATVKRYEKVNHCSIETVSCLTLEEAINKLDGSFDGAIIDLKLGKDGDEGNKVSQKIREGYRIPVAVFTGTPLNTDESLYYVGVYKKGEVGYDFLLDKFMEIYRTGLTKILGGRGQIEQAMDHVFWNNLFPRIDSWKEHVAEGKDTEKALLRFTLNHLMELLENDSEACLPDEMYISPPISTKLNTGSIVIRGKPEDCYIILSPACDLAVHNGKYKTDMILLCRIELFQDVKNTALNGISKEEKKKNKLKELLKNNFTDYYHWLPSYTTFPGGFINFRKVITMPLICFKSLFEFPNIQISSHFVKDIVSRYSSYYARQGQPDFDFDDLAEKLL